MKKLTFSAMILAIVFQKVTYPCSTFLFEYGNGVYVGQNLDMPFSVPAYISKNNKGVKKEVISWAELIGKHEGEKISFSWVSKYGSITFNALGKEFPEGGVNEKGLYVREMSLPQTIFPYTPGKPTMFMMQWIQYQLDNFMTVSEVVKHVGDFNIDGWGWHFFIADATGNSAIIEFVNGETIIRSGEDLPYKLLANDMYSNEINKLKTFNGFGGDRLIQMNDKSVDNRFVYGANVLKNKPCDGDPVQYGFDVLHNALFSPINQWSIVIDLSNLQVYFKSKGFEMQKMFSLMSFDFSPNSETLVYCINSKAKGDVSDYFKTYSSELSKEIIKEGVSMVFGSDLSPLILKNTHDYANTNK